MRTILSMGLGIVMIATLAYWVNPSDLLTHAAKGSLPAQWASLQPRPSCFILRSIRWRLMLEAIKSDRAVGTVFWTNMIGYAVNAFIPVRLGGEVTRANIIDSKERLGFFPSLSSIAVERILDLLVIASMLLSDRGLVRVQTSLGVDSVSGPVSDSSVKPRVSGLGGCGGFLETAVRVRSVKAALDGAERLSDAQRLTDMVFVKARISDLGKPHGSRQD